jgi:hypothetical protein
VEHHSGWDIYGGDLTWYNSFPVESIIILIRYEDNIAVTYMLSFFESHHKYQPYLFASDMRALSLDYGLEKYL